jgi:hypothetical protein
VGVATTADIHLADVRDASAVVLIWHAQAAERSIDEGLSVMQRAVRQQAKAGRVFLAVFDRS